MAGTRRRAAKTGARVGARAGAKAAPVAGRVAGKAAARTAKGQAKLARAALSPREPAASRFLKYGLFAFVGLAIGALLARAGRSGGSDGQGQTWGSGSPGGASGAATGTATGTGGTTDIGTVPGEHQSTGDPNRTGSEREYSDPSSGPLIGGQRRGSVPGVTESQEDVEQRVRSRIGEDPRTEGMPRPNVEVNDGVAELRGPAPTEEARQAAGEIAAETDGVREVRNMLTVS